MKVELLPRATPLEPRAVVALDASARALARRVLRADDETLAQLHVVASASVLAVLGPAQLLPWVEGAVYLGAEADAGGVLLPTTRALSPHAALVERALRRRFSTPAGLLALLPWGLRVISLRDAAPPDRASLRSWAERPS